MGALVAVRGDRQRRCEGRATPARAAFFPAKLRATVDCSRLGCDARAGTQLRCRARGTFLKASVNLAAVLGSEAPPRCGGLSLPRSGLRAPSVAARALPLRGLEPAILHVEPVLRRQIEEWVQILVTKSLSASLTVSRSDGRRERLLSGDSVSLSSTRARVGCSYGAYQRRCCAAEIALKPFRGIMELV